MEDYSDDTHGEALPEQVERQSAASAALTITIQSWTTPLVGVLMLGLGLLTGYFGRPLLNPAVALELTAAPPSPPAAAAPTQAADPAQSASSDLQARQQALMEAIIPQTIHFKGNPDAPVTLIEFSDFQ